MIDIAPRSASGGDRFVLSECFYRVALYLEGYRGALQLPTHRLFTSTRQGFWAGQVQFVGPMATMTPARLSILCPDLKALYYRDDFAEQAMRRCVPTTGNDGASDVPLNGPTASHVLRVDQLLYNPDA
ncbi:hypothetical protein [Sphingomonas solaris]|uniref:Uncharacterized protein n=1 Tax=Alterirhizorhabdus solaris TaxID=2529389 RepID=A0A558RAP4_9SPHN|nr:hypothetical protein [Sphingomonas solaris]TVV76459.1 hypothetical protein FOY91_04360 [Sphingomonas solaris]